MDDLDQAIAELDDHEVDALMRVFGVKAHEMADQGRHGARAFFQALSVRLAEHLIRRRAVLEQAEDVLEGEDEGEQVDDLDGYLEQLRADGWEPS